MAYKHVHIPNNKRHRQMLQEVCHVIRTFRNAPHPLFSAQTQISGLSFSRSRAPGAPPQAWHSATGTTKKHKPDSENPCKATFLLMTPEESQREPLTRYKEQDVLQISFPAFSSRSHHTAGWPPPISQPACAGFLPHPASQIFFTLQKV